MDKTDIFDKAMRMACAEYINESTENYDKVFKYVNGNLQQIYYDQLLYVIQHDDELPYESIETLYDWLFEGTEGEEIRIKPMQRILLEALEESGVMLVLDNETDVIEVYDGRKINSTEVMYEGDAKKRGLPILDCRKADTMEVCATYYSGVSEVVTYELKAEEG